jgi:hypothetical protein
MRRAFLFPLVLAVGFSLGFLLAGLFVGSDLSVPMSGKSTPGSTEGLGSRTCKGTGGSALVSITRGLSTGTGSKSSKPLRAMKAL